MATRMNVSLDVSLYMYNMHVYMSLRHDSGVRELI